MCLLADPLPPLVATGGCLVVQWLWSCCYWSLSGCVRLFLGRFLGCVWWWLAGWFMRFVWLLLGRCLVVLWLSPAVPPVVSLMCHGRVLVVVSLLYGCALVGCWWLYGCFLVGVWLRVGCPFVVLVAVCLFLVVHRVFRLLYWLSPVCVCQLLVVPWLLLAVPWLASSVSWLPRCWCLVVCVCWLLAGCCQVAVFFACWLLYGCGLVVQACLVVVSVGCVACPRVVAARVLLSLFLGDSLVVFCVFLGCSPVVVWLFSGCSRGVHGCFWLFLGWPLIGPWLFLRVPWSLLG